MQLRFPELLMLLPSVWISDPRKWTYLPKISAVSLVCTTKAFPSPALSAFLFAVCLYHMCDIGAWTLRAEKGSVAFLMAYIICTSISGPLGWCKMSSRGDVNLLWLLLFLSGSLKTNKPFLHCVIQRSKIWHKSPCHKWCFALLVQPITTRQTSFGRTNV